VAGLQGNFFPRLLFGDLSFGGFIFFFALRQPLLARSTGHGFFYANSLTCLFSSLLVPHRFSWHQPPGRSFIRQRSLTQPFPLVTTPMSSGTHQCGCVLSRWILLVLILPRNSSNNMGAPMVSGALLWPTSFSPDDCEHEASLFCVDVSSSPPLGTTWDRSLHQPFFTP